MANISASGGRLTPMFYVYILKNKKDQIYIGHTQDITKRLIEHNSGCSGYTKNKGPFEIIYKEIYNTRSEAIKREKRLKSGQGREWIKKAVLKTK